MTNNKVEFRSAFAPFMYQLIQLKSKAGQECLWYIYVHTHKHEDIEINPHSYSQHIFNKVATDIFNKWFR